MAHTFKTVAHTLNGVDPSMNPALAEIEKKTGPDHALRIMANRPQAMEDFHRLYSTIMIAPGAIDQRLREMLFLAVSTVNECDRCTARHIEDARKAGLSESEIGEVQTEQHQHFTPREQAALMYARELTRTAAASDDLRHRMTELFTVDQWVEITLLISTANFLNRFNNGLDIAPD